MRAPRQDDKTHGVSRSYSFVEKRLARVNPVGYTKVARH
jgi:hypothetical protein